MRSLVGLLVAVAVLCITPVAAGHAVLLSSVPADGAVVPTAPPIIELRFSEPVESVGARVRVIGPDGATIATDEPVADGRTLSVAPTAEVPDGTVTIAWSVISADGHRVSGANAFAVGAPSGGTVDPAAAAAEQRPRGATAAASAVRAARFAGVVALIGLVAVLALVWRPVMRRGRDLDPATATAADAAVGRSLARFAVASCGLLALAALAWIPVEAWANGIGIGEVLGLRQGAVDLGLLVLALVALPLALLAIRRRQGTAVLGLALVGLLLGALPALGGHPLGMDPVWPSVLVDWAHVLAAGAWGGGVVVLAASAPALFAATTAAARAPLVAGIIRRFTRVALAALALLVGTGAVATLLYAGSVLAVWDTRWGQLVIAKAVLVVLAVAAAGIVRRGGDGYGTGLRLEALVIIVVIAVTGILTGLSPTPETEGRTGGPLSAQTRVGDVIVQLDVSPALAGAPNEVHLIAIEASGAPADGTSDGEVVLSSPANGVERLPVRLERIERGHWAGVVVIPADGTWTGTGRVRIGEFDEAVVSGDFRVVSAAVG